MFWDLNGATAIPRLTRQRQIAATVTLFPTWDAEPITNRDMPVLISGIPDHKKQGSGLKYRILKNASLCFLALPARSSQITIQEIFINPYQSKKCSEIAIISPFLYRSGNFYSDI
jgi:hypothetical protein